MGEVVSLADSGPGGEEPRDEVPGLDEGAFQDDVKAFTLALLVHRPELGLPENANLLTDILAAFRDFDAQKAGLRKADAGAYNELSDDTFHLEAASAPGGEGR